MRMSASIVKLAPALLKAQKAMGGATKGSNNPFFKSRYADYGAVLEACKDPLNDNGFSVVQPPDIIEVSGKSYIETVLLHESGEWISGVTEVISAKQNDPQAQGSAITYARRFGLESLLGLPREDDDGNAASGKQSPPKNTTPQAPKTETPKPAAQPQTVGTVITTNPPKVEAAKVTPIKAPEAPKVASPVAAKVSKGW